MLQQLCQGEYNSRCDSRLDAKLPPMRRGGGSADRAGLCPNCLILGAFESSVDAMNPGRAPSIQQQGQPVRTTSDINVRRVKQFGNIKINTRFGRDGFSVQWAVFLR